MKSDMPFLRYIISMVALFVCYALALLPFPLVPPPILYAVFSYGIISVAYSRKVKNRDTVAWLACLWFIPLSLYTSLLVASVFAMFGKTENDSKKHLENKQEVVVLSKAQINKNPVRKKETTRRVISNRRGVNRLCLISGVLLACISLIEIDGRSGIGQIVCGGYRECSLFGEPNVATVIIVFVAPFVIAKIIEFIVNGFKETK